jgi:hypothetical protein
VGLNILSNLFEWIQILEDFNYIWIIQIYLQGKREIALFMQAASADGSPSPS